MSYLIANPKDRFFHDEAQLRARVEAKNVTDIFFYNE